ncbi:MAG: hypothetical protein HYR98_07375 [Nitrospirae bacterium]|nr:hypothetical protein [Nitrospirota bacterium]
MTKARLVFRRRLAYPDGAVREMVIWQLSGADPERPQGLKYRLYYGSAEGKCIVRYDNERGKGDHRHIHGKEMPYLFRDARAMLADFQRDVDRARRKS